ncbi:putative Phosphoglycerate/bisphosphoglycerate mutase [Thiomonas sp. X19]|uniref:SixA phosphatase family protein n=1 Tax=Thiomonas sp. X19 TaxID=1050370 RepID=UPI000B703A0A|nr:histidine phosphatase family protein [Thiomonas sp. X19]SCC93264.1 putative Phosphoglycerate/bisphosphoglycerate mutase [Thiomonas sp. X19]
MSPPLHVIFWRHAEAEDIDADADAKAADQADLRRALTRQGRRDASRVAAWIKAHVPKPWVVCASPALRARQTAMALVDYPVDEPRLAPDCGVDDLLAVIADHDDAHSALVLCGHQPTMGSAALRWLSGCEQAFSLRKSGLVWVAERQRESASARMLRACISADLLD